MSYLKFKLSWLHEEKVIFFFFFFLNSGVLMCILTDSANSPKCCNEWIQRTNSSLKCFSWSVDMTAVGQIPVVPL